MHASTITATEQRRIRHILHALRHELPPRRSFLNWENPLQLLVATMLSAQSTDARVNQVTPQLFTRYRTAAAFSNAAQDELEAQIRAVQ